jgi:hypothetical protein
MQLLLEKDEAIHGDEGIGEVIFVQWRAPHLRRRHTTLIQGCDLLLLPGLRVGVRLR